MDSADWVTRDEVRAALREWLIRSGRSGADALTSDTIVILGADGQTAKTHVPMRSAGGIVVYEQRWTRKANGWSLVEDREMWRAR